MSQEEKYNNVEGRTNNTTAQVSSNDHYEQNYGNRRQDYQRYNQRSDTRLQRDERPHRDNRYQQRTYRARVFVLDFNRFENRPEVQEKIMGNFNWRMEQGDTKELFYWSAPPLNFFGVGETLSVRFNQESEIFQYVITAKFLRGEVSWPNSLPDSAKFDFRLKKI